MDSVAMASARVGWAAAHGTAAAEGSYVLGTVDGGRHFTRLFAAPQQIVSVIAPDAQHAYFLESDYTSATSRLQALLSGGANPVTLWRARDVFATSASFPTAEDGFIAATADLSSPAASGSPILYKTGDGGASWSTLALPCGADPGLGGRSALSFIDASHGWLLCGGEPGAGNQEKALYETSDGGLHWSRQASTGPGRTSGSLPIGGYVGTLSFTSLTTGYIGLDRYGVLQTTDGGRAWTQAFVAVAPRGSDLAYAIGFLPGGAGWLLAGYGPTLWLTTDGGRTWADVYPAPAPTGPGSTTCLRSGAAVGFSIPAPPRTELLKSSDAGAAWQVARVLPYSLQRLQALTRQDLVAVASGHLRESSDGGVDWHEVKLPKGLSAAGLGFCTPGQGWVIGARGTAAATLVACQGQSCKTIPTPFTPQLAQATGPSSGFAAGKDRNGWVALFTTRDLGRHWTERLLPDGFMGSGWPMGLVGAGARRGLSWLYSGYDVLISSDAGRTWREISLASAPEAISSISFADRRHGLLVAWSPLSGTSSWRTGDGGRTFRPVP